MNHVSVCAVRLGVVTLLTAFGIAGCAPTDARAPVGTCQGQSRPQLDCSSEFHYDATNVKGGFSALGVGNLSADTEQKALRELDQETERFVAQARRLCDEYNKCVLDAETYATRSENLRRRMARVPELYDQVRSATQPEAQRVVLAQAYQEILPEEQRTQLDLFASVVAQPPGEAAVVIPEGARLRTGTQVRFFVEVSKTAYVYLFQRDASGRFNVLFPDKRLQLNNPLPASSRVSVPPSQYQSFLLNENDLGEERVYLVASLHPIVWLQDATEQVRMSGNAPPQLANIDNNPNCRSRALTLVNTPDGCIRQRGLVLAQAANAPQATIAVRSEAGDDVIARFFTFQHTN